MTISPSPTELTFGWVPYESNNEILSVDDYTANHDGSGSGSGNKTLILRLTENEIQ